MSDSRAVVSTDWDQDGDLDLWFSNRTSPRVRFMRNDDTSGNHFVAVRLEGAECNRDAIGARIEVHSEGEAMRRPLIRTLRAGDGYLSQSSKWLYFGLGAEPKSVRLSIHWPGGVVEDIRDLKPDVRYRITQGAGVAVAQPASRRSLRLEPSTPSAPPATSTARLLPHRRLPLPELEYVSYSGEHRAVRPPQAGYRLLVLWATWCAPCLLELPELAREGERLRKAGLEIVLLNVDDPEGDAETRLGKARATLARLGVPSGGGVATARTLELLDLVQRVLVIIPRPLALPSSFLVDPEGRLVAIYRGRVSAARLTADLVEFDRTLDEPRAMAVPFPGRWFTNAFPPDLLAIPQKMLEIALAGDALNYVQRHVTGTDPAQPKKLPVGIAPVRLVDVCTGIGDRLVDRNELDRAVAAYRMGVAYAPRDTNVRSRLATTLQRQGRTVEALAEHRRTLQIRPDHLVAADKIAWILATSPDPNIRDPQAAIERAVDVCRRVRFRMPHAVDTLAAAYAAAGRFDEATKVAERAAALAASLNHAGLAEEIRARARLYESGRPYIEHQAK